MKVVSFKIIGKIKEINQKKSSQVRGIVRLLAFLDSLLLMRLEQIIAKSFWENAKFLPILEKLKMIMLDWYCFNKKLRKTTF